MPIRLSKNRVDHTLRVTIEGPFTFGLCGGFLDALDQCDADVAGVVIDLERTDYIDSAAIGLLVQADIRLFSKDVVIRVRRGSPVDSALTVTNFKKQMTVEAA